MKKGVKQNANVLINSGMIEEIRMFIESDYLDLQSSGTSWEIGTLDFGLWTPFWHSGVPLIFYLNPSDPLKVIGWGGRGSWPLNFSDSPHFPHFYLTLRNLGLGLGLNFGLDFGLDLSLSKILSEMAMPLWIWHFAWSGPISDS
mgnify:CR=1 FL=1